MRWRKKALEEMQARIVQMGLDACPVCSSGSLQVWRMPTVESIGDVYRDKEDPLRDPEANINFLVHVECDACGYVLFFNSGRLVSADEPILVIGLTAEEEKDLEG
jgi:hypothetical protein